MSILIFSDIHASKRACRDLEPLFNVYARKLCCGDVIGYGREPEYVIDFLEGNGVMKVKGNHEDMLLEGYSMDINPVIRESIDWTKNRLSKKYIDKLRNLPRFIEFDDIYLTHTLSGKYIYTAESITEEIDKEIDKIRPPIIAIGHTHIFCAFNYRDKLIINPSSITKGRKDNKRGYAVYHDGRVDFFPLGDEIV